VEFGKIQGKFKKFEFELEFEFVLGFYSDTRGDTSSRIHPTLLRQRERLPHMTCHERVCVMCIRFLLQDVYRFELS
jgi:hypothetical protein